MDMQNIITIVLIVILTSIGFFSAYQMTRLEKNVKTVTGQIVEAHKTDATFKNQEFLHYFLANGDIWLSAMDENFKKTLSVRKYTCIVLIVLGLVMAGFSAYKEILVLAVYPILLSAVAGKLALTYRNIAKDEKKNQALALEKYKALYPKDPTVLHISDQKSRDKIAGWYQAAKRVAVRTGKLAQGKAALAAQREKEAGGAMPIQRGGMRGMRPPMTHGRGKRKHR